MRRCATPELTIRSSFVIADEAERPAFDTNALQQFAHERFLFFQLCH